MKDALSELKLSFICLYVTYLYKKKQLFLVRYWLKDKNLVSLSFYLVLASKILKTKRKMIKCCHAFNNTY